MDTSHRFGRFELQAVGRRVLADGAPVALGARAFDVLRRLVERRGALVGKDELLEAAWGALVVEEGNLQVQISALRRALGADVVATVPGRGYHLAVPVEAAPALPHPAGADADAPLLGRAAELSEIEARLAAGVRLVTITGAGGIGKTRLARTVAPPGPGRPWVDLAALATPAQLGPALAAATGIAWSGDPAALGAALAPRSLRLVLDNCEHLVAAVAELLAALLATAPRLQVLATSQEPLGLRVETVFRLDGLPVPPADSGPQRLRGSPAVALLESRAVARDRRFRLADGDLAAAAAICRRLDGLPLAIEMAAVRLPLLGAAPLAELLDARLQLLRRPERDAPARQQTLRAVLDWSCGLLDDEARAVLRRLSVCAGSASLALVEAVARAPGDDRWAVLDALGRLVDRSLLRVEPGDPPRYRLPETVRLYAAERLDEAGERPAAERRHGEALAAQVGVLRTAHLCEPDDVVLARHGAEHDDFEAAFERACTRGDAGVAAASLAALTGLDQLRGVAAPDRQRLRRAHALLPQADRLARARVWSAVAAAGRDALPGIGPRAAAEQAVEAWSGLDDALHLHHALLLRSTEQAREGAFDAAAASLAAAVALEGPVASAKQRMRRAIHAGWAAMFRGDAATYRSRMADAGRLAREAGASRFEGLARLCEADAACRMGDLAAAVRLGADAAEGLHRTGQALLEAVARLQQAGAAVAAGDAAMARDTLRAAWPLALAHGRRASLCLQVALLAAAEGRLDDAARLAGAAAALEAAQAEADTDFWERRLAAALAPLGPVAAKRQVEGAALEAAQALDLAAAVLAR